MRSPNMKCPRRVQVVVTTCVVILVVSPLYTWLTTPKFYKEINQKIDTKDFHLHCPNNLSLALYRRDVLQHSLPSEHRRDFRAQFRKWENFTRPDIGSDVIDRTGSDPSYLVYRCDMDKLQVCGGHADRLKGVLAGYIIANLTERIFKAEFLKPDCDITRYVVPNLYNWSLPHGLPDNTMPTSDNIVSVMGDKNFKTSVETKDLREVFKPEVKYIYFTSNLDILSGLVKSRLYADSLAWARDLEIADVYAVLYKRLFKLSPRLNTRLQDLLSQSLPTPHHRLICLHIRMGANPSNRRDSEVRNSFNNLQLFWYWITHRSRSHLDNVFLMSDSIDVIQSARKQCFRDRLVTIPGTLIHVDQSTDKSHGEMCEGVEKLILEFHMLMNCDVTVRGHSGLSVFASLIRGTDADLNCLHRSGDIQPCKRRDFDDVFI